MNQNAQSDVAGDFSSSVTESSCVQGEDISSVSSEAFFVMDIENATTAQQWTARSTGCSVGCKRWEATKDVESHIQGGGDYCPLFYG